MRLLMVTSSYPKFPGDATAPFIESIARGLAARGHQVDLVLPEHPQLRRGPDEPVRFFPYRYAPSDAWCQWGYAQSLESDVRIRRGMYALLPLVALGLRNAVSAHLQQQRYDSVHVHWVVPNAVLIADLVRAHRVGLVVSLHGSDVFVAERLAPARLLARRVLERAGAVSACSADLHTRALGLGAPPARTHTVPYGVDTAAFAATPQAAAQVRARHAVPEGAPLVVAVGRLVEKKGFSHLIEALARLPDAWLLLAGDGDLQPVLQAQARAAGARVRFAGRLSHDAVAGVLAAADVVAVPSVVDAAGNVDGLPNVLLEAMAAGRAVVASRVAGIPDVVRDGQNGVLVPAADPIALAEAIGRLLREPQRRRQLARAARETVQDEFSWERAAQRFEECYAQAAALVAG